MQRRDFLKGMGLLSAGAALAKWGSVQAEASDLDDYRALVCVFLFGGNDGNNMIVPLDDRYALYARQRGSLALESDSLLGLRDSAGVLQYGLHPAMSALKSAWDDGRLAVLFNAGTLLRPTTREELLAERSRPAGLFSHSDQQQTWQVANRSGALEGWGGRLADEFASENASGTVPGAIALTREAPFVQARSGSLVLPTSGGLVLRGSDSSAASRARLDAVNQLLAVDKNFELVAAAQGVTAEVFSRRAAVNAIVNTTSTVVKTAFNGLTSTVSRQLTTIAKLIERHRELGIRRQVFFVGVGGYDTHSGQLATQHTLLLNLSGALNAFYEATAAMGLAGQVTTFTLSDFGRTLRGNTAGGTDHAWGNHHLVLGGAVRGQTFYGQFPELLAGGVDDVGDEGRWIPSTSIDQYAATLARWFGVSDQRLLAVFPQLQNFPSGPLAFMT